MSDQTIGHLIFGGAFVVLAYWLGSFRGAMKQRDQWRAHMAKGNRYIHAVGDLGRWCGHTSPHAKLIAHHLRAHGEGLGYNAGTPHKDEACSVNGLRQQLARIDAAAIRGASGQEGGGAI